MRPQNHPLIKRPHMARKKTGKLIKARFISIETQNAGRHHSPHFSWTDADEVFQHPSFFNAPLPHPRSFENPFYIRVILIRFKIQTCSR